MLSEQSLINTMDIYRSYGAGSALYTGVKCRLVEQLDEGRAALSGCIQWTHYLECQPNVDIRDGITRTGSALTVTFTQGNADEVRIPDADGTRYIVAFVIVNSPGQSNCHKRVFLFRDDPVWTGTGWEL